MIVLVVNCGSSSLKYQVFNMDTRTTLADGLADRVAVSAGTGAVLRQRPAGGDPYVVEHPMPDHSTAMSFVLEALIHPAHGVIGSLREIGAVGHRVVHGGERFSQSVLIDDEVMEAIEECAELAPLHNPANLQGIRACMQALPGVPQVAVFDTAFHQTMPPQAYLYGLPYEYYQSKGIRRYGFHGTSHRYVAEKATQWLEREKGLRPQDQRIVTCHLGNGASMAAVKGGRSVDTTMGMTPLEGLLMGTRCGDLDPAIVTFLIEEMSLDARDVDSILNKKSGLLGLSGISSDMRDVKAAAFPDTGSPDPRARAAWDVFCYRIRKYIGAYAAALGGLDAVVFTAGIGENEAGVRRDAVAGLEFLGLRINHERNDNLDRQAEVSDISQPGSTVSVLVIPTDEELMIARDTVEIVSAC